MLQSKRHIKYGTEWFVLYPSGEIGPGPSPTWKITHAEEFNNFGHKIRSYSLEEIIQTPANIPWLYKNGKQRTYLCDLDHGTHRMWCSPTHFVC